jgi:hypothetical protein
VFDQHRVNSYLYRPVLQQQQPALHCLTAAQTVSLSSVVERASEVIQLQEDGGMGQDSTTARIATLPICIALLDHALYKDIYDSVIVGYSRD